jgi:hypothetical protein
VAELERELRSLAAVLELPPEPELAARVRTALGTAAPRRRPRRLVAVAVAVLAVAIGAALAVPDSRSAILRFFGLKGVSVIRVDELPKVGPGPLAFGERTTLGDAEKRLGFRALRPRLGEPDEVYVDEPAGYLILLYEGRVRLSEFQPGGSIVTKLTKIGKLGQDVERLTVDGGPALWIPDNHVVFELGRQPRLAGSTLLWEQGSLTLRLEGRLTEARALEIARSVR